MKFRAPTPLETALIACLVVFGSGRGEAGQQREPERAVQTREPSIAEVEAERALATDRFVRGDVHGALDTLNAVGEPRISEIRIEGLVRTKPAQVVDYLGLRPGQVLTSGRLARAGRRMDELPVASPGRVSYDLLADSVVVRPVVFERDRFYSALIDWAPVAASAIFTQEAKLNFSDVTGHGDLWSPSVRIARGRPRLALDVAVPAPGFLPGVFHVGTRWERKHYLDEVHSTPEQQVVIDENHVNAGASLSDWLTGWMRWEGGGAVDRYNSVTYFSLNGNVNTRAFGDRMATIVAGSLNSGAEAQQFKTGDVTVAMRSTTYDDRPVLLGLAGYSITSDTAPLGVWPSASTRIDFAPLRAHRLYDSGILNGEVFGRELVFASAEYVHPLPTRLGPSFLGLAGFVDAAQAMKRLEPTDSTLHVDIGAGLRINASRAGSIVRMDFGYGLRDGNKRVSVGYVQPWGRRD